jgi:hypothetical protein
MWSALRCDVSAAEQCVREHFAGQTLRWTDDPNTNKRGVRSFALEETRLYPFEGPALQERLQDLRQPGRTLLYRFPAREPALSR